MNTSLSIKLLIFAFLFQIAISAIVCPQGSAPLKCKCIECTPGTYSDKGKSCDLCPIGTYSEGPGAKAFTQCPPGTFSNAEGAAHPGTCEKCPMGTFSPLPGATSIADCKKCPAGSYGDSVGAKECVKCPVGKYSTVEGAQSPEVCVGCPAATFSAQPGASECTKCPVGRFSAGQCAECSRCEPGYEPSKDQISCVICPENTFSHGIVCKPCRAHGKSKPGSLECQYSLENGMTPVGGVGATLPPDADDNDDDYDDDVNYDDSDEPNGDD